MKPKKTNRLLPLLLALCLAAGCGAAPESSSLPEPAPEPPPESISQPEPEPEPEPPLPEGILPQEDPEKPGDLAGAELYYYGGNRLTLYTMEPETGTIYTVRENDFWNGREVESTSPSGNRVLLSSWDGAPSPEVVALSVYDIRSHQLTNLERTIESHYGDWKEAHWFPYKWSNGYRFTDENTILYQAVCDRETPGKNHLHLYDISGTVTARFLELESPLGEQGGDWSADCIWWEQENAVLGHLPEELGSDWVTWDIQTGEILSRRPGKNGSIPIGAIPYQVRDGVMYFIDPDHEAETFQLIAYHVDTDTREVLASGKSPRYPGMEDAPGDARGAVEQVWVDDIQDGVFRLRSTTEVRGSRSFEHYREAFWDPAAGGEIVMGEHQPAPAFPVDAVRGYTPVFATAPDGTGIFLPLPEALLPEEQYGCPPYLLAVLSSGKMLFLADQYRGTLPQEDPDRWGWLAGGRMYYNGGNRLTLYAMEPKTGAIRTVRESEFWNGRELEDTSPSGNRLLLSSWDGAPGPEVVALSLYDIEEDRLVNLSRTIEKPRRDWTESHWLPGTAGGYWFVDENTFCYAQPCFCETPEKGHFHFYDIGEDGTVTARFWSPECPEPDEKEVSWTNPFYCRVLREEGTILCRFPTAEKGWEWLTWDIATGRLLSRTPAENNERGGLPVNGIRYYIDEDPEHEVFSLTAYDMNTDTTKTLVTGPMIRAADGKNWDWSGRGAFEEMWLRVRDDGSFEITAPKTCALTEEGWTWDSDKEMRYYEAVWDPAQGGEIVFEEKVVEKVIVKSESGRETGLSIPVRVSEDRLLIRILPDKMQEEDVFQGPPHILSKLPSGETLFLAR